MSEQSDQVLHSDGSPDVPDDGRIKKVHFFHLLFLMALTLVAYHKSFGVPFVFDDAPSIVENPNVKKLWPLTESMWAPRQNTASGRPLVCFSLSLNHAISGFRVWSYHVLNLLVHLMAGIVLYRVLYMTLHRSLLAFSSERASTIAFWTALLWSVHPVQTESVTYIIQRAESMAGLFFLLTFYFAIRGFLFEKRAFPYCCAVLASIAGVASKEIVFTAPILLLLFDYAFFTRSFKKSLLERKALYLGLLLSWVLLALILSTGPRSGSASFDLPQISPWEYAKTQCGVLLKYIQVCFWPVNLVFDYEWPVARTFGQYVPQGIILLSLLAGSVWLFRRNPPAGFVPAWFFIILGPTSSFLPIVTEVAAEHRLYLPSISLVLAGVLLIQKLVDHFLQRSKLNEKWSGGQLRVCRGVVPGLLALLLCGMTFERNKVYQSELELWKDVVQKRPENARGHFNIANVWLALNNHAAAMEHYARAVQLRPSYATVYINMGTIYALNGNVQMAKESFKRCIQEAPGYIEAHQNLQVATRQLGCLEETVAFYQQELNKRPDHPCLIYGLGEILIPANPGEAERFLKEALKREPVFAEAEYSLGTLMEAKGKSAEAIQHYQAALAAKPGHIEAHFNLGLLSADAGQTQAAIEHFQSAVDLKPDFSQARFNLGLAYLKRGQRDHAILHLQQALESEPGMAETCLSIAQSMENSGNTEHASLLRQLIRSRIR